MKVFHNGLILNYLNPNLIQFFGILFTKFKFDKNCETLFIEMNQYPIELYGILLWKRQFYQAIILGQKQISKVIELV